MARSKPRVGGPASGIPASGIPAGSDGWGGPAKGRGNKGPGPGRPKGVPDGQGKIPRRQAAFRALMADYIPRTVERWKALIDQPSHPHHHTMLLKHVELEGEFKEHIVIDKPAEEMTDAELEAVVRRGRGGRGAADPKAKGKA
jgi:hypothetical protein